MDFLERKDITIPDSRLRAIGEYTYLDPQYYALYDGQPNPWEQEERQIRTKARCERLAVLAEAKEKKVQPPPLPHGPDKPDRFIDVPLGPQGTEHDSMVRPPIYLCERLTGNWRVYKKKNINNEY